MFRSILHFLISCSLCVLSVNRPTFLISFVNAHVVHIVEFPDLFSNWAHPSNYIRTTILLSLSGYQPALVAVLTFWNCHSVPLGSEMLSLNALVPSISCDSSSYRSWTISFSFFTIFLAFIPALLLLWLWYARRRVRLKQHLSSEGSEWIMDELDAWSYGPLYSVFLHHFLLDGYHSPTWRIYDYASSKGFLIRLQSVFYVDGIFCGTFREINRLRDRDRETVEVFISVLFLSFMWSLFIISFMFTTKYRVIARVYMHGRAISSWRDLFSF